MAIPRAVVSRGIASMEVINSRDGGCASDTHYEAGSHADESLWVHYQHRDGFDLYRWNAKECHKYLEDRCWVEVLKFYSLVAAGKLSLSDLTFHEHCPHAGSQQASPAKAFPVPELSVDLPIEPLQKWKGGKWDRKTFKIVLSYDGSAFTGWQRQPGLYTVQGLLEKALGSYSDGKRAASLRLKGTSVDAAIVVAGRTDKGVHAAGQVCSFYTWRSDVSPDDVKASINLLDPKSLRAISVNKVPRTFHPNFSARWRRYVYLLPLHCKETEKQCCLEHKNTNLGIPAKPTSFDVMAVNKMLSQLEGQQLSYTVFARDTKIARSRGPPTECFIYHARAALAELPLMEQACKERSKVMCVELVANRFLRKMVRVLVATCIREAAVGAPSDMLLRLTGTPCRRASAPPAPACGLCLTEVSYEDFSEANLLIQKHPCAEEKSSLTP